MRKLNKKDSADMFGFFMAICAVAIFIYFLPYLIIGALVIWLFVLILGNDDGGKGDDNE